MTIWSHSKRKSLKSSILAKHEVERPTGKIVPFAPDGMRRTRCVTCSKRFYCEKMTRFVYRKRHRSVNLCPNCDPVEREWKRMGTKEDEEIYLLRCSENGVIVKNFKSDF